jgi:hypothetical protein
MGRVSQFFLSQTDMSSARSSRFARFVASAIGCEPRDDVFQAGNIEQVRLKGRCFW